MREKVQVDVPLSNMGLNLFVEGRQKLVGGRISCTEKRLKRKKCVRGIILCNPRRRRGCEANKQPWKDSNATNI
jgi:hypothetical protein